MTLNLTQLKDLEYICEMAERPFIDHGWLERIEQYPDWLKRIELYRKMFRAEIERLEHDTVNSRPALGPASCDLTR